MFKSFEIEQSQDSAETYDQALTQTTNIANPVQNAVHIPIDPVEIQIKFPGHLHMYPVCKLVGPAELETVAENPHFVFR